MGTFNKEMADCRIWDRWLLGHRRISDHFQLFCYLSIAKIYMYTYNTLACLLIVFVEISWAEKKNKDLMYNSLISLLWPSHDRLLIKLLCPPEPRISLFEFRYSFLSKAHRYIISLYDEFISGNIKTFHHSMILKRRRVLKLVLKKRQEHRHFIELMS